MTTTNKIHTQYPFEQTFREYASMYNGTIRDNFAESEESLIDHFFGHQGFLQAGRKCEIIHFEYLDAHHNIDYKTHATGPNDFVSMDHSVATSDNHNKIVSIEPFSKDGTARILFQEYFALYDGLPKVFGTMEEDIFLELFAEDFRVTVDDQKYNQQQWMEAVKTCIEDGMKVAWFKFDGNF